VNVTVGCVKYVKATMPRLEQDAQVIPGPYIAITRHFREQHCIKTSNKERNDDIFCGQNGCTLKVLALANFATICLFVRKFNYIGR
jgi:hypothetical protein